MNRKWIEIGQDLLIIFLNHFVLISFGVTAMGYYEQDGHMLWLWSLLLIIPLLFYWARIKLGNFLLFWALHLAMPIVGVFFPIPLVPKILMVAISIVYVIWSIYIHIKEQRCTETAVTPVWMVIALGVMLLIETSYGRNGWEGIYIAMAIIYVAGYCIYMFSNQYLRFLSANESSAANIPEAEIFRGGFGHLFLYIAGVVAILVVNAKVQWFSGFYSGITSWIGGLFRKLFISVFMEDWGEENEGLVEEISVKQESLNIKMPDEEMTSNWDVLEKLIMIGVGLFLVGLVIFGIVKGVRYLYKGFHRNVSKAGNDIGIDIRETCAIEKKQKEGKDLFSALSNREKIRKIYRKQVLKNKTAIIGALDAENLQYMTARECCDKFAAGQLKKMYEKARYSMQKITTDDVRVAKSSGK